MRPGWLLRRHKQKGTEQKKRRVKVSACSGEKQKAKLLLQKSLSVHVQLQSLDEQVKNGLGYENDSQNTTTKCTTRQSRKLPTLCQINLN